MATCMPLTELMCLFVQFHSSKRSNLQRLVMLTRRYHGNVIGSPTEYYLGLIVLLSTNQH